MLSCLQMRGTKLFFTLGQKFLWTKMSDWNMNWKIPLENCQISKVFYNLVDLEKAIGQFYKACDRFIETMHGITASRGEGAQSSIIFTVIGSM